MATNLRELLGDLFTWRREYEARAYRHAAPLVLRTISDICDASQIEALEALGSGKLPVDAVVDDKRVWGHLRAFSDKGETCVKEEDAKNLGIPAHARRMWDVAVPLVVDAAQRARPGHYVLANEHHDRVADYCRGALASSFDPEDWFPNAIELLDRDGFTDELLQELWRECPHEAEYRKLSKPAETQMTDGQGTVWAQNELTLAQAAREFDIPAYALSRAASKASNKPGHLPTRREGSNVYVGRDHAREFATNYDARREQRIVGNMSDEGGKIVAGSKPPRNSAGLR